MRFLLTLAACAALTVSAFAQNGDVPREVTAAHTIGIGLGETRVFRVDRGIVSLGSASNAVAKATISLSDQEFFIEGVGAGEALVTVGYKDGTVYRMNVNVGGRTVRVYGNERRAKTAAYFFCTSTACTRAKPEADKRPVASESIAVTGRDEDGNIVTTTRTY